MFCLLPFMLTLTTGFGQKTADTVVNYLGTGEIITINKLEYKLSWSAHPVDNYYKQEYIPVSEKPDQYKNMVLVEFLLIDTPAKNIVNLKAIEIVTRKKTDAVANFMLRQKPETGEYLLDFILSAGSGDKVSVVELNAYRYKNYTDKAGHKGVLLFALSRRAYGDDVMPFLKKLNNERHNITKDITKVDFPEVAVK